MSNKASPVRFGLVFFGLAFFFNPTFAAIDVLPDFIGCLLIAAGLFRAATVQGDFKKAQRAFLKMALVDAAKNIALIGAFGSNSAADQPTLILLTAFVAAVVGLIFAVIAIRALFDGFFNLACTHGCTELYGNVNGGLSLTERMGKWTVIFLFVREGLCLLPEFAALATSTDSYSNSFFSRIYEYITLLRSAAVIVAGVIGIVWLVRLLMYCAKFRQNEEMLAALGEQYGVYYESHPGLAVERRHGLALLLLAVGAVFLVDFYLDFQNVIPDAVAGLLILLGSLIPAVKMKHRVRTAVAAGAYTVAASVSSRFAYAFMSRYTADEIARDEEASRAYLAMWVSSLAEFLIFLVLLAFLLLLLREIIWKWAGYRAHHGGEFEERCQQNLRAEFDGGLIRLFVFGFISALLSFLYDYIKEMPGRGIYHVLEFAWIFDFCGAVIFAVMLIVFLYRIFDEIKNRYRFD